MGAKKQEKRQKKFQRKLSEKADKVYTKFGATAEHVHLGLSNISAMSRGIRPAMGGFKKGRRYAIRSLACPLCLLWQETIAKMLPRRLDELTDPKAATRRAKEEPGLPGHRLWCTPCAAEWHGLIATADSFKLIKNDDDAKRMAFEMRPDAIISRATGASVTGLPGYPVSPAVAENGDSLTVEVEGLGECVSMSGFARLLYEVPLEEMGNKDIHPLAKLIKQRVNDAMATARALGQTPDLQDTINAVVDVQAMNRDIDRACAGESIDLAKNMLERLQQGVN